MNLLIVSISAPPKNSPESIQTGRFVKYLSREHSVTLLTTKIQGGWEPYDSGLVGYLQGIKRISLPLLPYRILYLVKKIIPKFVFPDDGFFFPRLWKLAVKKIHQKPDIIISRSVPYSSAVMAMKLAQHYKVPWIFHLSDLWTDSPYLKLTDKEKLNHQTLEKRCFECADKITLTSEKVVSYYRNKYPKLKNKFFFLPNVYDPDQRVEKHLNFAGRLRFVFTGRLYGSRSVDIVVRAFEHAVDNDPHLADELEVIFAGFFDEENIRVIRNSKLDCMHYAGSLPYEEARKLQHTAHVLLSIDAVESDPMFDMFFPSKLLDYMVTNSFIIAFTRKGSTTYDVVEGVYGKCFTNENLSEFSTYIGEMTNHFKQRNSAFFGTHGQDERYAATYNVALLNGLIHEVCKP